MTHLAIVQPCEAALALSGSKRSCLSAEAVQRFFFFILEFGTNLQRERLLYHFPINKHEIVSNQNVLAALRHYQNIDGGFGHGLEPDLRTSQSTVIATTVALQLLESVGAENSLMAENAIYYLLTQFKKGNWEAIHSGANDAPHAPWWRYEAPLDIGFIANPGAEVLRYIMNHGAMAREVPTLLARAVAYIKTQPLDMHELLCFNRLYETKALTKETRMELLPYLLANGYRLVNIEPKDWEEYCLTPLALVTHPRSVFAEFFADTIDANFDFLIDQQQADGAWIPNWSWAGEFPSAWQTAETEIKAELTLQNLLQFSAFNRLPQ
jgi:hypothetical protein